MIDLFCEIDDTGDSSRLLRRNLAHIAAAYWKAKDDGIDKPVVLVLDLREENGAAMARSRSRNRNHIQALVSECSEKGTIPTVIQVLSHDAAVERASCLGQRSEDALSQTIPRCYVRVMTFVFGRLAHTSIPEPKRDVEEYV